MRAKYTKVQGVFTKILEEAKFSIKREVWSRVRLTKNSKSKILRGVFQILPLKTLLSEEKKVGVDTSKINSYNYDCKVCLLKFIVLLIMKTLRGRELLI